MAAVNAGTSARGAGGGGRAAMRRASDPVVIVKPMDETSSFFVKAAASGDPDIVKLLLDRGLDPNATAQIPFTPLFIDFLRSRIVS